MLSICLALLESPQDKRRFEEFYNKFNGMIYMIAKDHLKTKEAAEDCTQEIMIHFAKDFHNIKQDFDDKSFRSYVRVISKCIAVDMYRKEKKHLENIADADLTEFYDLSADEVDACELMTLKQAIDAMPESYRYVFCLKYYYQYSGAEISAKTGISETSVRQKCMLGMNFVKNFVKDAENNE